MDTHVRARTLVVRSASWITAPGCQHRQAFQHATLPGLPPLRLSLRIGFISEFVDVAAYYLGMEFLFYHCPVYFPSLDVKIQGICGRLSYIILTTCSCGLWKAASRTDPQPLTQAGQPC